MCTTSAPVIAATSTSRTGLANTVLCRCANRLAIGTTSSGTQYISGPSGSCRPASPQATTRTVCPREMSVSANRMADTVVPLLPTLYVSMTRVMIIDVPGPPADDDRTYDGSKGRGTHS